MRLSLFNYFFTAALLFSFSLTAQTTLINPSGDGGFETSTTFLLNGWRDINGTQANQWYCGTGATGYTGARAAYIGTAATNNNYTVTSYSVVHFYRDIIFPAGQPNINLSFSWKGYGESGFDYVRVYLVPVTTVLNAGSTLFTGQIGNDYNLSSSWQTASIMLPCSAAGTTQRLVFTWINDGSIGTMPAGAIDNVSLISNTAGTCTTMLGTGVTTVPSLPYNSGIGTTCGAGNDLTSTNLPVCGSTLYYTGEDKVWVFTPATSGQVTINLSAPSASYTGLTLYAGCPVGSCAPGSGTCIAFAQDFLGDKSLCVAVNAGTTYYLVLDSWSSPYCNAYNYLSISAVASGLSGNTCANAVSIPSLPYSVTGHTTSCMGDDYSSATAGICNGSFAYGEDKVYSFTVSTPQCIGISLTGTSNNYITYSVYQGCPGTGGVCIGSGGGATLGTLAGSVTLTVAGTYYIIIDTQSPSAVVDYNLQVTSFGSGASNDRPFQAQAVPFNIPIAGSNNCSGNFDEPVAQPACFQPSGSNPVNSVWFSFIAPASGCVKIRTSLGTLTNTQVAIYGPVTGSIAAGSGSTLILAGCNQDLPPCGSNTYPSSEITMSGLSTGATYYIMVDGYGSLTGTFSLLMIDAGPACSLNFPPTPGQDCLAAFPVCKTAINVANPGPQAVGSNCEFGSFVNCLASGERGSYWYKVNIVSNGFLEFTIVPNDWAGAPTTACTDYDFAVWKTKTAGALGPANCTNLGSVAPISCNYSFLGVTGCYSAANTVAPPGYPGFDGAFQQRIAVTAGDEYLLNVSNFTNSTSGFALNFSTGSPMATAPVSGGTLVWTGTLNTDWYNPENWGGCAIPNCVYNVALPAGTPNQPAITGLTAVCGSVDISPGATLTLQASAQLKICNSLTNNGTLNALSGSTILMQSDSAVQNQTISGALTGTNKIWNLVINKPATAGGNTVTLNNNLDNEGNFTVSTAAPWLGGTFNASGMYHKVKGNFTVHYSSVPYSNYTPASTLEFNGTAAQNYFNRGTLLNVLMNHTGSGVVLGNSGAVDWMTISGVLTLTQGKLITGANRVNVINSIPAAVSTGNTSSYVEGFLKRTFAASGGAYDFPVGTSAKGFQRLNLNFGASNDRTNGTVSFINAAPATPVPFLGPDCGITSYDQSPLNNGQWQFDIIPAASSSPYTVTEYNANFSNAQAGFTVMTKAGSAPWAIPGICAASTITATQRTAIIAAGDPTYFATAQALTPLPVEMLYFEANGTASSILLKWITASETNNSGFEVYKSISPPEFEKIGWKDGAGTTTSLHEYEFEDYNVDKNVTYYYRLNQLDYNGQNKLTDIVFGRLSVAQFTLNAMPNPYIDKTNISLRLMSDASVKMEILNSVGQIVSTPVKGSLKEGVYNYEFSTLESHLSKGVYTVQLYVNGQVTHFRLLGLE
jgi:hypothetical protein